MHLLLFRINKNPAGRALASASLAMLLAACTAVAPVARIERQVPAGAAIANTVRVPAGHELIFHSGIIPSAANPDAPPGTVSYWGDTRQQAHSVLGKIKSSVEALGLSLGDVVQMTVFLGADRTSDPHARMDFAGFMEVYLQYFGAAAGQPNLPARSTVEVVNLVQPGMLVEIDVTLARPPT